MFVWHQSSGVWRNAADDPRGSATRAGAPITMEFRRRNWWREGMIDYIAPQFTGPSEGRKRPAGRLPDVVGRNGSGDEDRPLYRSGALSNQPGLHSSGWQAGDGVTEIQTSARTQLMHYRK